MAEEKKRVDASAKLSIVRLARSMVKNSTNRNSNILPGRPAISIILCIDTSEQTHHRSPILIYRLLSQPSEPHFTTNHDWPIDHEFRFSTLIVQRSLNIPVLEEQKIFSFVLFCGLCW